MKVEIKIVNEETEKPEWEVSFRISKEQYEALKLALNVIILKFRGMRR